MTQEGQGNVPKPIQDEIAAHLSLSATLYRHADEREAAAKKDRDLAAWHEGAAERLRRHYERDSAA